ncbi:MAG TPA: NUDIX hydrolase, partial [Erysipelotrichaceae bacterium]|nr:NUDIX hydrolase [Erysipelotrichaceae bacterium]
MSLRNEKGQTLEEFLADYDENRYRRPSNTVDMILMTVSDARLKILLVKRKDHPFIHDWAMPGGFINFDEDME